MSKKQVVIVGAGPAGLAAAFHLSGKADIKLIDAGLSAMQRTCISPDKCVRCSKKSGVCSKLEGIGGAGTFSDGKFLFETVFGGREVGSNLMEYLGNREDERHWIGKAKDFFLGYGIPRPELDDERLGKAKEIDRIARTNDMGYILSAQSHVGTDKLPELIATMEQDLLNNGIEIITGERIASFDDSKVYSAAKEYPYDHLILAPGRKGANWLEKVLKENKIQIEYRALDIGFRIETDAAVLEHLCDVSRDVKLSFRLPWNGDWIRTFCVCPNGVVTRETYGNFNLVNGASDSDKAKQTPNTNFALLMNLPLKKKANANNYGDHIALLFHDAGVDQPVVQRYGDINAHRRSREEKINEYRIIPTLDDVFHGDVGIGMPYRIQHGLLYGIEKLSVSGLMEGLNQPSTLVYAPELKKNGLKVDADKYLRVKKGLYVAGDGAGMTRGIVTAAASGFLAAEGILQNLG